MRTQTKPQKSRNRPVEPYPLDTPPEVYLEHIRPVVNAHLATIASIATEGGIACLVHDLHPSTVAAALGLGWNGHAPVFALNDGIRRTFAAQLALVGDPAAAAWLRYAKPGVVRVFVMIEMGTLCLNYATREQRWYFEPGTLDSERMS